MQIKTDLLRQYSIKAENHLMDFSDPRWKDCPYTFRSTGEYIMFYQGGPIDHCTHVPGSVAQPSAESECITACAEVMTFPHFRMLIHELLNKDQDILP